MTQKPSHIFKATSAGGKHWMNRARTSLPIVILSTNHNELLKGKAGQDLSPWPRCSSLSKLTLPVSHFISLWLISHTRFTKPQNLLSLHWQGDCLRRRFIILFLAGLLLWSNSVTPTSLESCLQVNAGKDPGHFASTSLYQGTGKKLLSLVPGSSRRPGLNTLLIGDLSLAMEMEPLFSLQRDCR